jgi:DNA-binding transcriptional LysR family regulator
VMTSLVTQGIGIAFTPEFVVRRSPRLRAFSVTQVSFKSDAMLTWSARLRDAPALRAFVGFVNAQHWDPSVAAKSYE